MGHIFQLDLYSVNHNTHYLRHKVRSRPLNIIKKLESTSATVERNNSLINWKKHRPELDSVWAAICLSRVMRVSFVWFVTESMVKKHDGLDDSVVQLQDELG